MGCLFCDIIEGKIPSKKVYEDDTVYAFEDISPQAPVHVLVVHKKHTKNLEETRGENNHVINDLFTGVTEVARIMGIAGDGYRVIINNGKAGGQVIWHLHVHVMGGREDMGPMVVKD